MKPVINEMKGETMAKKTNLRKEMDAEIKASKPRKAYSKTIAVVEGLIIAAVILLAVGFAAGNHYANNKNTEMKAAVTAATSKLKVTQ